MKKFIIIYALIICIFISGCGLKVVEIPRISEEQLESIYLAGVDKNSDKLLGFESFDVITLHYKENIYTSSDYTFVYKNDTYKTGLCHLSEFNLEKVCDVYGEEYIKPVYGDANADGCYSGVYAWYDDSSEVKGEPRIGTLWKCIGYDLKDMAIITSDEMFSGYGEDVCRLEYFYHLNDIDIETGKDLLNIILNPLEAESYGVTKQMDTFQILSGNTPEEVFFLGDIYTGKAVTADEVEYPDEYDLISIATKKPYERLIRFKDYGNGIIGYKTPEGTEIYIKTNR